MIGTAVINNEEKEQELHLFSGNCRETRAPAAKLIASTPYHDKVPPCGGCLPCLRGRIGPTLLVGPSDNPRMTLCVYE